MPVKSGINKQSPELTAQTGKLQLRKFVWAMAQICKHDDNDYFWEQVLRYGN